MVNHFVPVNRPSGYLQNTENYNKTCMLAASHENASTWYLYRGDRIIIDWLLNKTMITLGVVEGSRGFYLYFLCSHSLQLLAMTYVAAQKGWDGLFLLLCMVLSSLTSSSASSELGYFSRSGAAIWLDRNNIHVCSTTFRLAGRTQMLGAIQLINDMDQAKTNSVPGLGQFGTPITTPEGSCKVKSDDHDAHVKWMDTILAVSPRREAWLQHLRLLVRTQRLSELLLSTDSTSSTDRAVGRGHKPDAASQHLGSGSPSLSSLITPSHDQGLTQMEIRWVEQNALWALKTARCIMRSTTATTTTNVPAIGNSPLKIAAAATTISSQA